MPTKDQGFETMIASSPDYQELVAEMYFDGKFVAQLNKEKGDAAIEIEFAGEHLDQTVVCRRTELVGFLRTVEEARQRLLGEIP